MLVKTSEAPTTQEFISRHETFLNKVRGGVAIAMLATAVIGASIATIAAVKTGNYVDALKNFPGILYPHLP